MSPRRNYRPPPRFPGGAGRLDRVENWPDGDWVIRPAAGAASHKTYRCPGCDQEIMPGVPHLVAWPADSRIGSPDPAVNERRHWHTPCWRRRRARRR